LAGTGPLELFVVGDVQINEGFLRTVFVELPFEDRAIQHRICKVLCPLGKVDMGDLCLFFLRFFEDLFNICISLVVLVLPPRRKRLTVVIGANLRVIVHLRNIIVSRPGCQPMHHIFHLGRIPMVHEISPVAAAWFPRSILRHTEVNGTILFSSELLASDGKVDFLARVAATGGWIGLGGSTVD
jgi:hypothetical protein